jgi:hypothetical protein
VGGFGSGRTAQNRLTTSYKQLTTRVLERAGGLAPGKITTWEWREQGQIVTFARVSAEDTCLRVLYAWWSASDDWVRSNVVLRIEWTTCQYGGRRPWIICPKSGCGRRMSILYDDREIACRFCRRLSYPSQRVHPDDRSLYRAQGIRNRLGGSGDISLPFPLKPRGMPSFAYVKMGLRAHRAESEANQQVIDMFGLPSRPARQVPAVPTTHNDLAGLGIDGAADAR